MKEQLEEASRALSDLRLRDQAYEHFAGKGVRDPFGAAQIAVRDVTLKGIDGDELPSALDRWIEQQTSVWGSAPAAGSANDETEASPPETVPRPRSPFAAPNPAAEGESGSRSPIKAGSPEYNEWKRGKTSEQIVAAKQRGEITVSDETSTAHASLRRNVI